MKQFIATIVFLIAVMDGARAQQLRRAVAAADLVVVATVVRVIPAKTHVIHRLRIDEVLRGPQGFDAAKSISVVVTKRVAVHNKPTPGKPMIMCLHDHESTARRIQLPAGFRPYFKMSGHPGSAVVMTTPSTDPSLAFTRVLIASQRGQSSRKTAEALFDIALLGDPRVRTEAALALTERAALTDCLTEMHLSDLLARAAGETEDVHYKIALASICASHKLEALVPTLCMSAEHVGDEGFLRALGRFARHIHGDRAHEVIATQMRRAKGKTRERLIVAVGATSTEGALETLLSMRKRGEYQVAVEAALRIHGSPRATAAIAKKKQGRKVDEPKVDRPKVDEKDRK